MRTALFILGAMWFACPASLPAQEITPEEAAAARTEFDFLIGAWKITRVEADGKPAPAAGERYVFRKLPQGSIEADWEMNRGTPQQPRMVIAKYYSGFDNASRTWNFYFVSERSAQLWPGKREGDRWYFHQTFEDAGKMVPQRQWWEPIDANSFRRYIETSDDGGRTYKPVWVATFTREK